MGTGVLKTAGSVEVSGEKGAETINGKHVIVATGARARDLPFAKADGDRIWTYRHAMTPKVMPTNLLVIGSGAIGIEFASTRCSRGSRFKFPTLGESNILPLS